MQCYYCWKDIAFWAQVCPWCDRETVSAKRNYLVLRFVTTPLAWLFMLSGLVTMAFHFWIGFLVWFGGWAFTIWLSYRLMAKVSPTPSRQ